MIRWFRLTGRGRSTLPLAAGLVLILCGAAAAQQTVPYVLEPQVVLETVDGTIRRERLSETEGPDLAALDWAFLSMEGVPRPVPSGAGPAGAMQDARMGPATAVLSLRPPSASEVAQGVGKAAGMADRVYGRPVRGAGDRLEFKLELGAALALDVDWLEGVVFPGRVSAEQRAGLLPAESGDRLFWLRDGGLDRIDGTLEEFTAGGARFDSLLGSREFLWSEIAGLFVEALGETTARTGDAPGVSVICDLTDGGRLRGRCSGVTTGGLRLALPSGGELNLPLAGIAEVARDDGRLKFLSELAPVEAVDGSPFDDDLGLRWPHRMDRSVTGRLLRVGGAVWRRGIGVHSPSRLSWELDGTWAALHGSVGIDDEVLSLPHHGAVVFRVIVGDETVWESPTVRGGEGARAMPAVDLRGARRLTLEVDMDAQSFVADRADWLRLLLVRG